MSIVAKIENAIFNNQIAQYNFDELALQLFYFQAENCIAYKNYLQALSVDYKQVKHINEIKFMPISFFKTHKITSVKNKKEEIIFNSSGTTNKNRSNHFVYNKKLYQQNILNAFNKFYGNVNNYYFLALLPSYIQQKNSSLIFMVDYLMQNSKNNMPQYFLYDYKKLIKKIKALQNENEKIVLIGVSFALWEMAEKHKIDLSNVVIFETGGMKGRRKEITRQQLHHILNKSFNTKNINSEYGMCELLSQSYSTGNGIFKTANTKKIILKEINDPFAIAKNNTIGKINVIDLANIYSCAFIETADIGKKFDDESFEIIGRIDNSDLRGCNLFF